MNKNCIYGFIISLIFYSFSVQQKANNYPYMDASLSIESRLDDLIKRMTLEEKIQQLDMYKGKEIANMDGHEGVSYSDFKAQNVIGTIGIGSVHDFYPGSSEITNKIQKYALEKTRLGIPVLFIEEGLHGYNGLGSTYFPIPLQLASAWDTSLVCQVGHVLATETRAHGINMLLAPVLCITHDPRWGRVEETYGEDPYLTALMGVAMVKGMQGNDLTSPDAVVAEPKHFVAHGIPEGGSNASPVNIGEREARSIYFYPFEKAIREGGAMGIMAAYHEIDGIPCVDNKWLLTEVLRKEWGFKGLVLSDLGAILMTQENHKVATDPSDAVAQAIKAGMNMQFYDFSHENFKLAITNALKEKKLDETDINNAVKDVLRVKFMLGLFDNPYIDPLIKAKVFHTDENLALSLKAAQEGVVLLKNDKGVLPINKKTKTIAVIGTLATCQYLGGYAYEEKGISILDGLKQRVGTDVKINYTEGYTFGKFLGRSQASCVQKAVDMTAVSDIAIVVVGENKHVVGEGRDRASVDLDEYQMNLVKALKETGKPVVVVLFNGRPLTINWIAENIPSIVETWFSGEMGGLAIADVLLGNVNPSGKLPITFPRSLGQAPFYYNHKPSSTHVYVDDSNSPLFPFGFGLSYTSFKYSGLQIIPSKIYRNGSASVSVKVKNTGKVKGTEVVQLYIRDVVGSVTTPVIALKGFNRITLQPGESGIVTFNVGPEQLALWNREMKHVVEPGEFKIMAGSSSGDIRQQGSLWVTED